MCWCGCRAFPIAKKFELLQLGCLVRVEGRGRPKGVHFKAVVTRGPLLYCIVVKTECVLTVEGVQQRNIKSSTSH